MGGSGRVIPALQDKQATSRGGQWAGICHNRTRREGPDVQTGKCLNAGGGEHRELCPVNKPILASAPETSSEGALGSLERIACD